MTDQALITFKTLRLTYFITHKIELDVAFKLWVLCIAAAGFSLPLTPPTEDIGPSLCCRITMSSSSAMQ